MNKTPGSGKKRNKSKSSSRGHSSRSAHTSPSDAVKVAAATRRPKALLDLEDHFVSIVSSGTAVSVSELRSNARDVTFGFADEHVHSVNVSSSARVQRCVHLTARVHPDTLTRLRLSSGGTYLAHLLGDPSSVTTERGRRAAAGKQQALQWRNETHERCDELVSYDNIVSMMLITLVCRRRAAQNVLEVDERTRAQLRAMVREHTAELCDASATVVHLGVLTRPIVDTSDVFLYSDQGVAQKLFEASYWRGTRPAALLTAALRLIDGRVFLNNGPLGTISAGERRLRVFAQCGAASDNEQRASIGADLNEPLYRFNVSDSTSVRLLATSTSSVDATSLSHTLPSLEQCLASIDDYCGGLNREFARLYRLFAWCCTPAHRERFDAFGLRAPRGVLLHGPPGCGKTLLVKTLARLLHVPLFVLSGADVASQYYGESEQQLRDEFQRASAASPSILFLDECDALAPRRDERGDRASSGAADMERRLVSTLLSLLDDTDSSSSRVLVVGATNRLAQIDEAMRRPGRFDEEIEVSVPDASARERILHTLLDHHRIRQEGAPIDAKFILQIAERAHGFVGADLAQLTRAACLRALRREADSRQSQSDDDGEHDTGITANITEADLDWALLHTRPSSLRDTVSAESALASAGAQTERTTGADQSDDPWQAIGGYESTKERLREMAEWPLRYAKQFRTLGIEAPRGLLLYGPPGCGKTMMCRALAKSSGLNFLHVKGPELMSKWVGESERQVRRLFQRARAAAPCLLVFDEIDALARKRGETQAGVGDRVVGQLLAEIDGIEPLRQVLVIAITNRPDLVDAALLRAGRLDRRLHVDVPDVRAREAILIARLRRVPHTLSEELVRTFTERTAGRSGAELASIVTEAALAAIRNDPSDVSVHVGAEHMEAALHSLQRMRPLRAVSTNTLASTDGAPRAFKWPPTAAES